MYIQILNHMIVTIKHSFIMVIYIGLNRFIKVSNWSPLTVFKVNISSQNSMSTVITQVDIIGKPEELPSITNFIITITVAIYCWFVCTTLLANTVCKTMVAITGTYCLNSKCVPLLL